MSSSTEHPTPAAVRFRVAAYDDPQSVRFVDALQQFYRERYGGADRTPVRPDEFAPPYGLFLLGDLPDEPGTAVCCGGWRRHDTASIASADAGILRAGDAEVKRMWVDPAHRRRGLARAVLAELEATAQRAGCLRIVLETGDQQPEATALYVAAGYQRIPSFGVYRAEAGSDCFARDLAEGSFPGAPVRRASSSGG